MNDTVFEIDGKFVFQHKLNPFFSKWTVKKHSGNSNNTWQLDLGNSNNGAIEIKKGFVAILGESGAGKSTLLSVLSGFEKLSVQQRMCIRYCDENGYRTYADKGFGAFRKQTYGYIFQRCYESKPLSAIENIALPLFLKKFPADTIRTYAKGLLSFLNLRELSKARVNELSGGQLTRIGILRGIAQTPKVLFADEPANNLDSQNVDKILMVLDRWRHDTNGTVIMVTHHVEHAFRYANQIIILKDNKNSSGIAYNQQRGKSGWTDSEKKAIITLLAERDEIKQNLPSPPVKANAAFFRFAAFLSKVSFNNLTSIADGSRTISLITLLGFLLLFILYFSGNQLMSWFGKVNDIKNNTEYLRRFEITVQHPPGLNVEVQKAIEGLNAGRVAIWLKKKILNSMATVISIAQNNKIKVPEDILCANGSFLYDKTLKQSVLSVLGNDQRPKCHTDERWLTAFERVISNSDSRLVPLLQKYSLYLHTTINANMLNPGLNINQLKVAEKQFLEIIRLSDILTELSDIPTDQKIAKVFPRWESGVEFVKQNGQRTNITTTIRWLDYQDPLFYDSRLKYIEKEIFCFLSNADDGIVIDKETLVDVLGYPLNTCEIKAIYGSGEIVCIPVKAVVGRMIDGDKYHAMCTFGFGEKLRSNAYHCEENRIYNQLHIDAPGTKQFLSRWKNYELTENKDEYGNQSYELTQIGQSTFELYCESSHAKNKMDWHRWIETKLGLNLQKAQLRFDDAWELTDAGNSAPPFMQGTIYASSKSAVRALGNFLYTAFWEDANKKWRINVYDYEDKIKFAQQSDTLLGTANKVGLIMLGMLFILFLTTNMLINIRNKITEIAIFRSMGGSFLGILYIFNIQILMLVLAAVGIAHMIVYYALPYMRDLFLNNVISHIWKDIDNQREAIQAIASTNFYTLFTINLPVILSSCLCVVVVVTLMITRVRFSSQYSISRILKER